MFLQSRKLSLQLKPRPLLFSITNVIKKFWFCSKLLYAACLHRCRNVQKGLFKKAKIALKFPPLIIIRSELFRISLVPATGLKELKSFNKRIKKCMFKHNYSYSQYNPLALCQLSKGFETYLPVSWFPLVGKYHPPFKSQLTISIAFSTGKLELESEALQKLISFKD